MLLGFPNVLVNLSPHFFWRGWFHFFKGYCTDNLSWELGSCYPYHRIDIFVRFLSILIKSNRGEQFKFAFISSPHEVDMGIFFSDGNVMCTPF
jgi:hypothetical protein